MIASSGRKDLQCILLHTPAIDRSRTKLAQGQTLHTYLVTEVHIFSSPFNIGSKRSQNSTSFVLRKQKSEH